MSDKEEFWVTLWTKGAIIQEKLAGPFNDIEDARYEAQRQVAMKLEGSVIAIASSRLPPLPEPHDEE